MRLIEGLHTEERLIENRSDSKVIESMLRMGVDVETLMYKHCASIPAVLVMERKELAVAALVMRLLVLPLSWMLSPSNTSEDARLYFTGELDESDFGVLVLQSTRVPWMAKGELEDMSWNVSPLSLANDNRNTSRCTST